jgi:hypothetical protein
VGKVGWGYSPAEPSRRSRRRSAWPSCFPKSTDLPVHSREDLAAVAAQLNSRPRKTLDWKTPAQPLDGFLAAAA